MFDFHYDYRYINSQKAPNNGAYIIHSYSFRGKSNERYIVSVEEYNYFVFVPKFYLAAHKNCKDKYNKIINKFDCNKVISTVIHIMLLKSKSNPFASFAFIGVNSLGEEKANTKRFKLYSKIMENLISPLNFEHRFSLDKSAYLILNRHNNEPNLLIRIERMFNEIYDL